MSNNQNVEMEISDKIKIHIVKDLVEPMYIKDVKSTIEGKKCWRLSGQIFETMSKILVAIGGIISFSSGYFNNPTLGFIAGSISTISLATLQFSSFSYGENKKQASELNILLKKLGIDTIPELNRDVNMATMRGTSTDNPNEENNVNDHDNEINLLKDHIIYLENQMKNNKEHNNISSENESEPNLSEPKLSEPKLSEVNLSEVTLSEPIMSEQNLTKPIMSENNIFA
jgi:hypothetical protein